MNLARNWTRLSFVIILFKLTPNSGSPANNKCGSKCESNDNCKGTPRAICKS